MDLVKDLPSLGYTQGRIGPCPNNTVLCSSLSCPGHCRARGYCDNGECKCYLGYQGLDCSSQLCSTDSNCPDGEDCEVGGENLEENTFNSIL